MSQTTTPTAPLHTFHCAILHPTEARVLMLQEDRTWSLPSFEPKDTFVNQVAQVNQAAQERFGIAATVLRCADFKEDQESVAAVFILEPHGFSRPLAEGERWIGLADLRELVLAAPEHRELLQRCLSEDADPRAALAPRPPWASRGWLEEAKAWIHDELGHLGRRPTSSLEQIKQWSITSLWRQRTSAGDVYFKAVPPLFANEGGITQALAGLYPGNIPVPLAVKPERSWMLLEDFGGKTLREAGVVYWQDALTRFSHMQVAATRHVGALLGAGCTDRRLDTLSAQLPSLLHDAEELGSLSEEERQRLHALEPKLNAMIQDLNGYGIPQTLVHGDLNFNNVALSGDRIVFFDWTDGAIAHPFFDLMSFVYFDDAASIGPERWEEMLAAYLEPWTAFEPMPRLRQAYDLAIMLALLHHAISYKNIRESQEEGARWELGGTTAYLLRTLLGKVSK
jgi:hypothetical protein